MKKGIFAGTFDPFTLGHEDTVSEALKIFDKVQVAILFNPQKTPAFTIDERVKIIKNLYKDEERVEVTVWDGCIVDLLKKEGTPFYIRGIRNTVDLEYENANHFANVRLYPEIVTVYLPCKQEHLHISSTLARNCLTFDKPVEECVSERVKKSINDILENRGK